MKEWLISNEPIWLFSLLASELLIGIATFVILILEYFYDAKIEEEKKLKRRVNKKKVKIVIDGEGNARIAEAPAGLDVDISHEGR